MGTQEEEEYEISAVEESKDIEESMDSEVGYEDEDGNEDGVEKEAEDIHDEDEGLNDGEDEYHPNDGEQDDDEVEKEFIDPKKSYIKVMIGLNSARNSTSNKKKRIFSYHDAGFGEEKEFNTWVDLINGLNDAFDEYMHPNYKKGFDVVRQMMRYGSWKAIGRNVEMEKDVYGPNQTSITGYMLNLSLFDTTMVDLNDANMHTTKSSYTDWVYVSRISLEGSGFGLFSVRTFYIGDIIYVYVGRKLSNNPQSVYALVYQGKIVNPEKPSSTPGNAKNQNNAKYTGVLIVATKNIKPHQEICVSYNFE